MPPVFRFAPSPNGYLHLGHALSALTNAGMARAAGGRLLLRIEDIDATRCRPEYEAAIYEDLAWLGLSWEQPVWRESEHLEDYRAALGRLQALGLVYPSFESRAEIAMMVAGRDARGPWPRDPDGAPLYPGNAKALEPAERRRRIETSEPYALRLDMAAALARFPALTWTETGTGPDGETGVVLADPAAWGDVILARKDAPASYHLAVVVDDAAQGVTLVTRGADLFEASHVHRLLQALLGLPVPEWQHHRLLSGPDGRRFAKRDRSLTLRALREAGRTPAEVRTMAGFP
jgi:glutamyl-Q tRNA(Asp) synthetase